MPKSLHVALLRGINVTGKNLIRMEALREMCIDLKLSEVRTYIQSGNIIFASTQPRSALEAKIERGISSTFSLSIPAIIRSAHEWIRSLEACPFPAEAASDPSHLYLLTSKAAFPAEIANALQIKGREGEMAKLVEDSLWIYYPSGLARSKITPSLIDRLAGSPSTARNWKTASAILEMLTP